MRRHVLSDIFLNIAPNAEVTAAFNSSLELQGCLDTLSFMYPQRELSHVVKSGLLAGHFMGPGDVTVPRPIHLSGKVSLIINYIITYGWVGTYGAPCTFEVNLK